MWGHAKNGLGGLVRKNDKFVLIRINKDWSHIRTYDVELSDELFNDGEYQNKDFVFVNSEGMEKKWFKKACQIW
tara:strand:- start:108 stop:329 length:222 start_codon:yes stop_codon:yes gene_type:complete